MTALLGGCIPAVPPAPVAVRPEPVEPAPSRPSFALDLTTLRDDAALRARRPIVTDAVTIQRGIHMVAGGETLIAIAQLRGISVAALSRANGLSRDARPPAGTRLIVPAGRYHRVREGQTGIGIAQAYGLRWSSIVGANALAEPYQLRTGDRLEIPGPASTPAGDPSPEARAAAFQIGIDDLVTGSSPARRTVELPPAPSMRGTVPTGRTRFVWPAPGRVVSRFGRGSARFNQGIDIDTASSMAVQAAGPGTVAYVGNGVPGFGGLILIRHPGNFITAYGRIATANVSRDSAVVAGQTIGVTERAAPLHFQVRRARVPVDPLGYLPPR